MRRVVGSTLPEERVRRVEVAAEVEAAERSEEESVAGTRNSSEVEGWDDGSGDYCGNAGKEADNEDVEDKEQEKIEEGTAV